MNIFDYIDKVDPDYWDRQAKRIKESLDTNKDKPLTKQTESEEDDE